MNTAPGIISRIRISEVWAALGGSPLRHGRGRAFWRDGDGYNVSVSDDKNCWHDFVSGDGGGVLNLVQKVRGGSRADALRLVADVAGVTLDTKALSNDEKHNYAEHRHQAASLAQQCAWWARAYTQELEHTKANAYERGDWDTLAWSGRELYQIQTAVPTTLMDRFLKAMKADPEGTAELVDAGYQDERHAYGIAVAITLMLANAAEVPHA